MAPDRERLENIMKNHAKIITTTLVMALALTVGACGDTTGKGGESASSGGASDTTAANITFRTDPRGVDVWIDGKKAGTTPVVIAVEAGKHDVEFKRDGFESVTDSIDVVAGKDLTVTAPLAVTGSPEERVERLLAALEIPEHENLEPKAHRGSTPPVMLYWPKKDVRKGGIGTWRLEIGEYDDDGFLVFKKGSKVLHREPFKATGIVMEGALPPVVMEALKRGSTISWGIDYENKRKKDVMTKFTVKDGRALDRKLTKLAKRSVYKRAGDLERAIARIELKRNYRFYTEALTDAMSVLNTWPDTMIADKVIADSLQRLKLKDTILYVEIMKRLRGAGGSKGKGKGTSGLGNVTAPRGLAQSLVAPKIRKPVDGGSKAGGMKPGMGVTPTGGDQKREPGPIEEGTDGSTDQGTEAPDARQAREQELEARRAEAQDLQDQVSALEKIVDEMKQAEESVHASSTKVSEAQKSAEAANKALEEARKALADAEASGDAARTQAAQQALDTAQQAAENAGKELETATQNHEETKQRAMETMERHSEHGASSAEVEDKAREAKEKLEELRNQPMRSEEPQQGSTNPRQGVDNDPLRDPNEPTPAEAEAITRQMHEQGISDAKERLEDANTYYDNSTASHAAAKTAYDSASQEMDAAEASGDQNRIDAAEAALGKASEELARTQMDVERADAAKRTAAEDLVNREQEFQAYEQQAANQGPKPAPKRNR